MSDNTEPLDLGKLWWEAGVKSARENWPKCTEEKWEDITEIDRKFMRDAAANFLRSRPPIESTDEGLEQAWLEIYGVMHDTLLNNGQRREFVLSILKGQLANPPKAQEPG